MEDLKKIQEFFSKPLEEGKQLDNTDFTKVVKAVEQTGHPVTVLLVPKFNEIEVLTGMDAPDDMIRDLSNAVDSLGYGRNDIIIAGDSSNLSRREYSDIFRVNGGHQDYFEESVNEMDMNDPVLMKMRAAKMKADKLAKMRAANAGDDGNDKFFDNAKKIAFLKKERAQLMRDMEQEAEPEGGPIADEYGSKLNRIDKAIAKLSGRKEMTYDQAIAEAKVDYDFSERELIRVLRQLKRGASTEIDMIKAFTKALGRDITKDELFSEAINEYDVYMPSQEEVDRFFELTQNETHYLNSKPVMGQEGTFNLMPIEPWDEYDYSNWMALVRKAKQRGKSIDEGNDKIKDLEQLFDFHTQMDNKGQASIIKDKIEKLRKLSNSGEIDGDEFLDKFNPLQKQLKSIDEDNSYARVSKPRFKKDKNSPNFLNVYLDYDIGPGGNPTAFGKETMSGQIRRLSSAKARKIAHDIALDLEANFNLEDIEVTDLENGKVRIFAVSDDFIDMDPNMLSESSKGALNYFNDLKYYYQKAFRYLDVEEREEYKQLAKDFFSKLQVDNKVRAVGLEEAKVEVDDTTQFKLDLKHLLDKHIVKEASKEEENEFHKELDKLVHKTFGHSSDEKKKSRAQELAETIKLGEGVIEEELCPKGKAYIKRRKAAGEKSSAYLSGRAVKVCKGQMSGRKKKK